MLLTLSVIITITMSNGTGDHQWEYYKHVEFMLDISWHHTQLVVIREGVPPPEQKNMLFLANECEY